MTATLTQPVAPPYRDAGAAIRRLLDQPWLFRGPGARTRAPQELDTTVDLSLRPGPSTEQVQCQTT